MAAHEAACAAWARHFCGDDEAVTQYVCQVLLAAIEDGDCLADLADAVSDFVPHASRQSLAAGLSELDALVHRPPGSPAQPSYAWLLPAAQQAQLQPVAASQQANESSSATADAEQEEQQQQKEQQEQQPASRPSSLRIAAAEFKPAIAASTVSMAALNLDRGAEAADSHQDDSADTWQHSDWPSGSGGGSWQASSSSSWTANEAQEAAADAAAASEKVAGGPAAEAAFLAVLGEQFPLFSAAALAQLFAEQGGSLAATIHTLCGLEAELEGQTTAAAATAAGSPQAAGPAFTADDFPSLGSPTASGGISKHAGSAAGYASKARAAADLPSQPRSSGGMGSRQRPAASAPGRNAAPIWQAQGVQQFATGVAAAKEYAELRAEARDHARLRNAYFQQATQAYLAGNKRLARELGAKGRWHGEQMHAAHAAAAAETFTRRNPGAAAAIAGASGSSSSGSGVQTVDLHGLHVSEALELLESLLLQLQPGLGGSGGRARRLRVVVGAGTHGKVPARLPAAVRRYLQEQGLPFSEPYAGLLEISLH